MTPNIGVNQRGYTLAGALTLLAVMSILMAISLPLWTRVKQRDMEEELIFRGNEYVEAIARYHQKFGSYPPDLETLEKLKFIRRLYADPMTKSGKWKVLHPDALLQTGAAGTVNVPGQKNDDEDDARDEGGSDNKNAFDRDDDEKQDETPGFGDEEDEENANEEEEVESAGPLVGVVSRSKKASFKIYNGQAYYNKWVFVYALPQQQQQQRQQQQQQRQQQGQGQGNNQKPGTQKDKNSKNPSPTPQPDINDDDDDNVDWEKE